MLEGELCSVGKFEEWERGWGWERGEGKGVEGGSKMRWDFNDVFSISELMKKVHLCLNLLTPPSQTQTPCPQRMDC